MKKRTPVPSVSSSGRWGGNAERVFKNAPDQVATGALRQCKRFPVSRFQLRMAAEHMEIPVQKGGRPLEKLRRIRDGPLCRYHCL